MTIRSHQRAKEFVISYRTSEGSYDDNALEIGRAILDKAGGEAAPYEYLEITTKVGTSWDYQSPTKESK